MPVMALTSSGLPLSAPTRRKLMSTAPTNAKCHDPDRVAALVAVVAVKPVGLLRRLLPPAALLRGWWLLIVVSALVGLWGGALLASRWRSPLLRLAGFGVLAVPGRLCRFASGVLPGLLPLRRLLRLAPGRLLLRLVP